MATTGLPNLIIIGAAKCGTTSLAHYLGLHPEIQMSVPKELDFFTDPRWSERLDWYRSHFDPSVAIRGEASVSYTMFPEGEVDVPTRIRELLPEVKLIYLVGDPLERVISQWIMWHTKEADLGAAKRAKLSGRPLAEILDTDPENPFVYPSLYGQHLERYLSYFERDAVLVLDQADLRERRVPTLAGAFSFLGVDSAFESPEFSQQLNQSHTWKRPSPVYSRLRRAVLAAGTERLPQSLRRPIGKRLRRAFSQPLERPAADEVFPDAVRELLHGEAERLRRLTGMPFASWSV